MRGRRLARRLGSALFVVGLAAVAVRERDTVAEAFARIARMDLPELGLAFGALVLGRGVLAITSWIAVTGELASVPARPASVAWLRAAVAKYVPGVIWHPLSAVERLTRAGGTAARGSLAMLVDVAAIVVGAALVGAPAIPALLSAETGSAWWLLLALPALVLLHPRVFAYGLHVFERVTGWETPSVRLPWTLVGRAIVLHAGGWALAGVSLWLLLDGLGTPGPVSVVVPAAALSWAVGFLFVLAPAGLGVREAVLTALLGPVVGVEAALGAAVLSRLLHVALDVGGAALSLPLGSEGGEGRLADRPQRRTGVALDDQEDGV